MGAQKEKPKQHANFIAACHLPYFTIVVDFAVLVRRSAPAIVFFPGDLLSVVFCVLYPYQRRPKTRRRCEPLESEGRFPVVDTFLRLLRREQYDPLCCTCSNQHPPRPVVEGEGLGYYPLADSSSVTLVSVVGIFDILAWNSWLP